MRVTHVHRWQLRDYPWRPGRAGRKFECVSAGCGFQPAMLTFWEGAPTEYVHRIRPWRQFYRELKNAAQMKAA